MSCAIPSCTIYRYALHPACASCRRHVTLFPPPLDGTLQRNGSVPMLPWSEAALAEESDMISSELIDLNRKGFLTINSQVRDCVRGCVCDARERDVASDAAAGHLQCTQCRSRGGLGTRQWLCVPKGVP